MPMADIFGILQFVPLAVTAGAALFMGAQVGWRRWTATCVGLARRAHHRAARRRRAFTPFAILAIVSVLFSAARDLLSRSVPPGTCPRSSSSPPRPPSSRWPASASSCSRPGRSPRSATLAILARRQRGAARRPVLAGRGHAHRRDRRGGAVPLFDHAVGHPGGLSSSGARCPDLPSWIGIAIVTAAGLYTFLREQRLARAAHAS